MPSPIASKPVESNAVADLARGTARSFHEVFTSTLTQIGNLGDVPGNAAAMFGGKNLMKHRVEEIRANEKALGTGAAVFGSDEQLAKTSDAKLIWKSIPGSRIAERASEGINTAVETVNIVHNNLAMSSYFVMKKAWKSIKSWF